MREGYEEDVAYLFYMESPSPLIALIVSYLLKIDNMNESIVIFVTLIDRVIIIYLFIRIIELKRMYQ